MMNWWQATLDFIDFHGDELWQAIGQHIVLSYGAVAIGLLVAVPIGILLTKMKHSAPYVLGVSGGIQTIPSLALFGFALPLLGIGFLPAFLVMFVYSIFPMLRNTYTAIREVDPALIEAGRGMGMTGREILFKVQLPLALPLIIAGIRISTVYIISWATLGAKIGAGGLGDLIFTGLSTVSNDYLLAGAIPAALLALMSNYLFNVVEKLVTPRGIRRT